MKVYIAARYSRKDEVAEHASTLRLNGIDVCSTWMNELHGPAVQLAEVREEELREYATRDLQELYRADAFVIFSESDQTYNKRGGRHVEHGFALALGKPIYVVGPRENIFHYISGTTHVDSVAELVAVLHESPAAPNSPYSDKSPSAARTR